MSFESPGFTAHRASAPQRASLFADPRPADVRGSARRPDTQLTVWVAKTLGVAILALSMLFALALMTWSIADPSFANGGVGLKARNALGPIGAIVSDIVIQSLGFASVFALMPPVFWAAQLLSRHGIEGARTKVMLAPVAVLSLAAFLSGLPKVAQWPLGSGYGGLLGDFGFQFVMGMFGIINAERAPLVTGVCLMAAGFSLLMLSLGITPADLKRMVARRRTHVPDSAWVSHLKAAGVTAASDEDVLAAGPSSTTMPPLRSEAERELCLPMPNVASSRPATAASELHALQAVAVPAAVAASAAALPIATPAPVPQAPVAADRHAVPAVPASPPLARAEAQSSAQPPSAQLSAAQPPAPAPQPAPRLGYRRPPLTLLPQSTAPRSDARDLHVAEKLRARKLIEVLENYGVRAEVKGHVVGPVVTTFTVEPTAGTRSSRLIGLAADIARGLGVASVRIQTTAARSAVLIEIPHDDPVAMGLRDFISHESYHAAGHVLPVVLGASAVGEPCVSDLADGGILVAGQDRTARDALINTAITSLVYRHTPTALRFVLVGTDRESAFERWAALPHLALPPAADMGQASDLLSWAAAEIDARTLRMRAVAQAQTIEAYNQRLRSTGRADAEPMPHLVLVLADLAAVVSDGSSAKLAALDAILRRGKTAGVYLIAATSSAGEDALPPGLVAAFPARVASQLASKSESRALFGETGAEDLPEGNDVLISASTDGLRKALGPALVHRVHAALIRASEATAIAMAAANPAELPIETAPPSRPHGPARDLQRALQGQWASHTSPMAVSTLATAPASDSLYDRAVALVRRDQVVHGSVLQHHLSLTAAMANELLDQMARNGIVSATDAAGSRRVLIGRAA